ncbi:hypothetical protein ASG43_08965 [Aureimonas sp. Leaf454]|uniref:hypothetical protein n=1 Tax=Aureimonas sp. Leaf454 TaxID=1736381 RepID=UPI000701D620|nr:hypothetical protein [Aureimonas sp. Leaf454]KQT48953.1 hypothetical protein ASG43_08965 [Aureimonas sp. Leaf454]
MTSTVSAEDRERAGGEASADDGADPATGPSGETMPSADGWPDTAPDRGVFDGAGAIRLIEKAAFTLRDYETKFVAIEQDTRAFILRVKEEQQRTAMRVGILEQAMLEAQKRADSAEMALAVAMSTIADLHAEGAGLGRAPSEAKPVADRSAADGQRTAWLSGHERS